MYNYQYIGTYYNNNNNNNRRHDESISRFGIKLHEAAAAVDDGGRGVEK